MSAWQVPWDGRLYEMPGRDSQRGKVYDAEHTCFAKIREAKQLANLTQPQLQSMVNAMWESDCVQDLLVKAGRQSSQLAPEVRLKNKGGWAKGCPAYISLPPWALNLHTFIHEIAHAIAPFGSKHSWMFCAVMLLLVEEFMGLAEANRLRRAYIVGKVKFRPRVRHIVSVAADRK